MGMHDESWCDACGTSLPYSEDDVTGGNCEKEFAIDFIESFLNYLSKYVKDGEFWTNAVPVPTPFTASIATL